MDKTALFKFLNQYFDDSELRSLCFELGIDYERLPGQSKSDKVRELVLYCERHGLTDELITTCRWLRPRAPWPDSAEQDFSEPAKPAETERAATQLLYPLESPEGTIFFGEQSEKDHNLQFVRDMLTERAPDRATVLATYRDVRRGRTVRDDEQSQVKVHLKLSGVVHREEGMLRVRNQIYEHVFDIPWVKQRWPLSWWAGVSRGIKLAAGLVALLTVALAILTTQLFAALDTSETRRTEAIAAQQTAEASQREISQRLRVSQSQSLAFGTLTTLDSDPEQGLLVAIDAVKLDSSLITDDALRQALAASHIRQRLSGHQGPVRSVGWSPDGKQLVRGGDDGTVQVWDAVSGAGFGLPPSTSAPTPTP